MVTPSWDMFSGPRDQEVKQQESELRQEIPGEIQDQKKPEAKKPEWGEFLSPTTFQGDPDPTEDESFFETVKRNALSNTARFVERIAGGIGDIEKFAKDTLANLPKSGGYIGEAISSLIGQDRWEKIVRGAPGQQQKFPTSEMLKKGTELVSGDYTKPKTPKEASLHQNLLVTPVVANAVKEVVEGLGFGEEKAQMAKASVWLPMSLAFNVNAPRYASELMNRGRQGIPNTVQADVPRFLNRLDQIERSPLLISTDPRTALARQTINSLRNDLANGQTNAQSLMTMYDGVNAAKRNRGMFELNRTDQNFARRAIDQVRNAVRDEIKDAAHQYPNALQDWQNGVTAWSVIHRSNAISNWVQDLAKGPYSKLLSGPTAALFGVSAYGGIKSPLIAGTSAAVLPATYKTGQTLFRIWNDPNLARYYWSAISGAMGQNIPAFISNYEKLNNKLQSAKEKGKTKK